MMALTFASPWVLFALAALPLLWWLLRVTPPSPRREVFPAIRLLFGLVANAETPARTPWWLLALRILAAALVIFGLARPVIDAGARVAGDGTVLLAIDDGWAAARDWPRRLAAAHGVLDRAERDGRRVMLLATAPGETGAAPAPTRPCRSPARPRLEALRPKPWASDRAEAAAALRGMVLRAAWSPSPTASPTAPPGTATPQRSPPSARSPSSAPKTRPPACCCRRGPRPTAWWCASPRRRSRCRARPPCSPSRATAARWRAW